MPVSLRVAIEARHRLAPVNVGGRWQYAPGGVPVAPEQVVDQHLRGVISHLLGSGAAFLQNFHGAIDSALENIDPPNLTRQQETAVLIGRPLAIVRASVDLQLQGLPAVDQTWTALRRDLRTDVRRTAAVTAATSASSATGSSASGRRPRTASTSRSTRR